MSRRSLQSLAHNFLVDSNKTGLLLEVSVVRGPFPSAVPPTPPSATVGTTSDDFANRELGRCPIIRPPINRSGIIDGASFAKVKSDKPLEPMGWALLVSPTQNTAALPEGFFYGHLFLKRLKDPLRIAP